MFKYCSYILIPRSVAFPLHWEAIKIHVKLEMVLHIETSFLTAAIFIL